MVDSYQKLSYCEVGVGLRVADNLQMVPFHGMADMCLIRYRTTQPLPMLAWHTIVCPMPDSHEEACSYLKGRLFVGQHRHRIGSGRIGPVQRQECHGDIRKAFAERPNPRCIRLSQQLQPLHLHRPNGYSRGSSQHSW